MPPRMPVIAGVTFDPHAMFQQVQRHGGLRQVVNDKKMQQIVRAVGLLRENMKAGSYFRTVVQRMKKTYVELLLPLEIALRETGYQPVAQAYAHVPPEAAGAATAKTQPSAQQHQQACLSWKTQTPEQRYARAVDSTNTRLPASTLSSGAAAGNGGQGAGGNGGCGLGGALEGTARSS